MSRFGYALRRRLAVTALAGLAAAAPALAQAPATGAPEADRAGAPTVDEGDMAEIIVTAQKREQNLQDVAAAVSVVTAAQFDNRGGVNIQSLTTLVPSLNFKDSATTLDSSLFLRGVGTINFSIAAEPSVAFVVDGVVQARSGEAFGDLYDVERIEVLRGPQGTLFGKNASAGVVSVVTRKPGRDLGGYVEGTATTDEEYKIRGAVDLPLGEGLAARITGSYGQFDGIVRNLTLGRTVNGYKRYGLRGVLVAEPTDTLTLTLTGDWRRQRSDCCAEIIGTTPTGALANALPGVRLAGDATRQIRQNQLTFTRETSYGGSLQADLDIGAAGTLTSISAYRNYKNFGIRDADFLDTNYALGNPGVEQFDFGPQPSKTYTQELRLTSPGNQTLEYVLGGFYYYAKQVRTFERDDFVCSTSTSPAVAPGLVPCFAGTSNRTFYFSRATFGSRIESLAGFGNLTFNISDAFRLIAGARYTHDEVRATHDRIPAPLAGLPGILNTTTGYRLRTTKNDFSGKVGAQFDPTDDLMVYATYSQGYKGPAFNVFFNQNALQTGVIPAETSDAYEAGAKYQSPDRSFILNGAIFYAKYKGFQANSFTVINGTTVTQLTSAGTVSTTGFELDSLIRPTRNFTVTAGIAYTDAQIDRFTAAPGASTRRGERLPLAPRWKGTAGANWTIETGGGVNVQLGSQVSLTSDQVSSLEPPGPNRLAITIDGYTVVDGNIAVVDADNRWKVNFIGRNLFDVSYASLITTGGPGGSLRYLLPRDVDRYFGVQLRLNFGAR